MVWSDDSRFHEVTGIQTRLDALEVDEIIDR